MININLHFSIFRQISAEIQLHFTEIKGKLCYTDSLIVNGKFIAHEIKTIGISRGILGELS